MLVDDVSYFRFLSVLLYNTYLCVLPTSSERCNLIPEHDRLLLRSSEFSQQILRMQRKSTTPGAYETDSTRHRRQVLLYPRSNTPVMLGDRQVASDWCCILFSHTGISVMDIDNKSSWLTYSSASPIFTLSRFRSIAWLQMRSSTQVGYVQ